jgi:hypothetical protein
MMSSQKKKKNMKRRSLSELQIFMLCRTLEDVRFQIVDIQRDAHQDKLETQDMLQAILDSCHQLHDVSVIFIPLSLFLYFLYLHTVGSANFEFGSIICAHFVFNYAFYFNYGLFSFVSLI